MRLIDANALEEKVYTEVFMDGWGTQMKKWDGDCWIKYKLFKKCLNNTPTFEVPTVEPVKIDALGLHTWACGDCGNIVGTQFFKNLYCSHCGKKVKWDAIKAEPIKQGKWNTAWFDHKERIVCSECGCLADRMTDYCPNCGVRMTVAQE